MEILPAIDIYDGKAVRLYKGDYAQMTVYSEDPAALALDMEQAGARWLHVVDLAGAKEGTMHVLPVLERICKETSLNVEIGGGIRSPDAIDACLSAGAERVILGTKAVTDPAFLDEALAKYGSHIAIGADAREGMVAVKGWTEVSDLSMERFLADGKARGVSCAIVTDIAKDGAMQGTNLALYETLVQSGLQDGDHGLKIIASGGVSSLDDIRALAGIGVYGAILGKAMYTGAVKLEDALAAASR